MFFLQYIILHVPVYSLQNMKCEILNIFNQQKNDMYRYMCAVSIIDLFYACFMLEYARQLNCLSFIK